MITTRDDLRLFQARLNQMAAADPEDGRRLEFHGRVVAALFDQREGVAIPSRMGDDEAAMRVREGFPLLDNGKLLAGYAASKDVAAILVDLIATEGMLEEEVSAVRTLLGNNDPRHLGEKALGREGVFALEVEGWSGGALELIRFVVHGSLKPLFETAAVSLGTVPALADWAQGYCPLCGGLPALGAFVGEEGRRQLLCHRCGHVWSFQRVRCPFCDNTNHEKLEYFRLGEDTGHRVDVCRVCQGFIKGVEVRERPADEVSLEAEDLGTAYLEIRAVQEGFTAKSPNILGLRHLPS